ncbi:MAG: hypothetical protein V1659_00390, partial [Candidatus Woesearchaeota archaeon]
CLEITLSSMEPRQGTKTAECNTSIFYRRVEQDISMSVKNERQEELFVVVVFYNFIGNFTLWKKLLGDDEYPNF